MINNLNILLPEIFLTQSIFSILMIGVFIKNSFNLIHTHPNSYLSAAYYVKAPENCGNIHFYEPNEVKKFHTPPIEKMTELSSNGFSIKPEEGNLLIFPSYLYHDVGKSLSDDDRIVISFNVSILPIKK